MDLLKEFVALEKRKSDLRKELEDDIPGRLKQLEDILSEQFLQSGTTKMTVDGRTVRIGPEIEVSPRDGNRAAVLLALRSVAPDLIKEDYHPGSLRAYVKDLVKGAQDEAASRGEKLLDLASAIPDKLAQTLKVSTIWKLSSRKA
jgi:hypothetical protein